MLFSPNRDQIRQYYCEIWRKHTAGETLEPLEVQIRDVILEHPEYHGILMKQETALGQDYLPELGETNPFLHMGLHLALRDQVATDRPAGIRAITARLRPGFSDMHALEHQMMECLAEMIWRSQRDAAPPDEAAYLNCLRQLESV